MTSNTGQINRNHLRLSIETESVGKATIDPVFILPCLKISAPWANSSPVNLGFRQSPGYPQLNLDFFNRFP
jgi:hypothetical protein